MVDDALCTMMVCCGYTCIIIMSLLYRLYNWYACGGHNIPLVVSILTTRGYKCMQAGVTCSSFANHTAWKWRAAILVVWDVPRVVGDVPLVVVDVPLVVGDVPLVVGDVPFPRHMRSRHCTYKITIVWNRRDCIGHSWEYQDHYSQWLNNQNNHMTKGILWACLWSQGI